MANPNPYQARAAKRKKRSRAGNLEEVQTALFETIELLRSKMRGEGDSIDVGDLCRMSHALAQLANVYRGYDEQLEIRQELDNLREEIALLSRQAA